MKISEFRKLIREEVRKVIKEASNPNTLTLSDFISKKMIKVIDDQPLKNIAKFLKTSESDVMVVVEGSAAFKKLYKFYDGPKYVNSFNQAPLKPLDVNPDAEFGSMYYSKPGNVFFFDGGGVNNDYYFITKKQLNTLTSSGQSIKEVGATMTGDYNDSDFDGPAKKASLAYLKTPEGAKAAKIFKSLVTNEFDASDLEKAIKACKFKTMNHFKAAAKAGGLEIDGLGNVDNEGNGDFEVLNDTYTDQGVAIAFFNDKFDSVG